MVLSYEFEMFGEVLKISADWGVIFEGVVREDNIESILFENVPLAIDDRSMVRDEMLHGTGYMLISRAF
jgi:hypothetical protein